MAQGSINQSQKGATSPLVGIAAALQAVNSFYGIDTQRQQERVAELSANQTEKKQKEMDFFGQTGRLGPMLSFEKGIKPTASSEEVYGSPPQQQQSPTDGAPTQFAGKMVADNSPVNSFIQSQKKAMVPNPGAGPQTNQNPLSSMIRAPLSGVQYINPADALKAEKELYDTRKSKSESEKAAHDVKFEDLTKAQTAFNTEAKTVQDQISAHEKIAKDLTSGNPTAVKNAIMEFPLVSLGAKKISGQIAEMVENPEILAQVQNLGSKARTGLPSPNDLKLVVDANNSALTAKVKELDDINGKYAGQLSQVNKLSPEANKKAIFPSGHVPQTVETEVLSNKTDAASGYKEVSLHVKTKNGWVPMGEKPTKENTWTDKEIAGGLGKNIPDNVTALKNIAAGSPSYVLKMIKGFIPFLGGNSTISNE